MTKPIKWSVHPGKTQISLGCRPVWSEFSLCTFWVAKYPMFFIGTIADCSDDLSLCWVHRSFCWFCCALPQVFYNANMVLKKKKKYKRMRHKKKIHKTNQKWIANTLYHHCEENVFFFSAMQKEFSCWSIYEPPHDQTNKMSVCPAKTQIILGICPGWSESSLSPWRTLGSSATH